MRKKIIFFFGVFSFRGGGGGLKNNFPYKNKNLISNFYSSCFRNSPNIRCTKLKCFNEKYKYYNVYFVELEHFFLSPTQTEQNTPKKGILFFKKPYFSRPKMFLNFWSWKIGFFEKENSFFFCVFFSLGGG